MIHYSIEAWLAYARGSGAEADRDAMEVHLLVCDDCLALYMEAAERSAPAPVTERDTEYLVSRIMEQIPQPSGQEDRRPFWTRPIVQYAVAASITIVLVGTGAFQQLVNQASELSRRTELSAHAGFSEHWTNKAGDWLDDAANLLNKKEVRR